MEVIPTIATARAVVTGRLVLDRIAGAGATFLPATGLQAAEKVREDCFAARQVVAI